MSHTGKWLIFMNDSILLLRDPEAHLPDHHETQLLRPFMVREYLLGQFNGSDIYCAELHMSLAEQSDTFEWLPLRHALDHLGDAWYNAASKAITIINWDRNHQFCGRCAHNTVHTGFGFERRCPSCQLQFYPRISPSIIVLIQRDDKLLMARSHHFKPGVYGLIAGFVEAGESIEDAVHREVYEETQLTIKNLRYFGSQSWPFPDSLMIGFFADYAGGEIVMDNNEIEDAGWYTPDNLPGRPSTKLSIASKMLDHYLQQQG